MTDLQKDMDDAHAAQLAESGQRDPMDAFFDRPESRARPLTPSQEAHWRDDLAADRWGSTPRWSSQSVAALMATLDESRTKSATRIEALEKSLCALADEAQKVINEPYREDINFEPLHAARKAAYRLVHART